MTPPFFCQIKDLRARTSAPLADVKKALDASGGDTEKAFDWLRKRGAAKASDLEKAGRATNQGLVAVFATDTEASVVQVRFRLIFVKVCKCASMQVCKCLEGGGIAAVDPSRLTVCNRLTARRTLAHGTTTSKTSPSLPPSPPPGSL